MERLPSSHKPVSVWLRFKVFLDPTDNMVFECSFDYLVEEIRGQKLMNIRKRKVCSEWLSNRLIHGVEQLQGSLEDLA